MGEIEVVFSAGIGGMSKVRVVAGAKAEMIFVAASGHYSVAVIAPINRNLFQRTGVWIGSNLHFLQF
ncbi:hypothetical protein HZB93_02125 [Candidatus Falkowbacteria bacterium]|nr:hypothetical protein [Candidatus Falkowbacteria bacterium]